MPKRKISGVNNNDVKSEHVFTWKIKNYSFCAKRKGEYISSPLFNVENLCIGQWYLNLYPKGIAKLKDDSNFMSCCLVWKPQIHALKTPALSYSLEIVKETGGVLKYRGNESRVFTKKAKSWGIMRFFKIDELTAEMSKWKEDVLVIRCRIKYNKLKKQKIYGSEACTIVDVERRFYEWCVKMPLFLQHSESIVFPFVEQCSFEIILRDDLSVFIQFNNDQYFSQMLIRFKIAVHDEKENEITSKCAEHVFIINREIWKFPDILTRKVLDACKVDSYSYNFKLKCELSTSRGRTSISKIEKLTYKTSTYCKFLPFDDSNSALQTDFKNLYHNKNYCDITLRTGDNEFSAHRLFLSMRSPVFSAMFEQNMLENNTGVVDVTDVDGETMKIFLEYLYTGRVDKLGYESAKKLMLTADKYQVASLVDECVSFLKADLSVENVLDIISVAELLNCESLKTYAFYFIRANVAKIFIRPYWMGWMKENINLASEILAKLFVDLSEI